MMKAIVVAPFCDKDNFDVKYSIGQEVKFNDERVMNLVQRGLVRLIDEKIGGEDAEIDINASVREITPLIEMCTDSEKLYALLEDEKRKEKPRETITKAIEKRIEELEA